jgi:hypothetical protein
MLMKKLTDNQTKGDGSGIRKFSIPWQTIRPLPNSPSEFPEKHGRRQER